MDSVTASNPLGERYSDIYGPDWAEMSEAERQAIIEADLAEARAEAEAEAAEEAAQRAEDAEHARRCAALDAGQTDAERIIAQHGLRVVRSAGSGSRSRYLAVQVGDDEIEVRISDHGQPPGGGYAGCDDVGDRRHGESDVLWDVRRPLADNVAELVSAIRRFQGLDN